APGQRKGLAAFGVGGIHDSRPATRNGRFTEAILPLCAGPERGGRRLLRHQERQLRRLVQRAALADVADPAVADGDDPRGGLAGGPAVGSGAGGRAPGGFGRVHPLPGVEPVAPPLAVQLPRLQGADPLLTQRPTEREKCPTPETSPTHKSGPQRSITPRRRPTTPTTPTSSHRDTSPRAPPFHPSRASPTPT